VNPSAKPQTQAPSHNHNTRDNDIRDQPAHDDTNSTNRSSEPSDADNADHNSGRNHNRTSDPGGVKIRNCNLVHDPGGDDLNTKDGAPHGDDSDNSSNSDNMFRAVDIHHIHSRDRNKAVPDTPSPCAPDNLPAILPADSRHVDVVHYLLPPAHPVCPSNLNPTCPLDFARTTRTPNVIAPHPTTFPPFFISTKRTNATQCPLPPQRLADSLNFDPAPEIARISSAPHLDTSQSSSSSSSNIIPCADDIHHSFFCDDDKSITTAPYVVKFAHAIPSRSTDSLPPILPANPRSTNAAQCALSLPSPQHVLCPLNFSPARATSDTTTTTTTHTPPASRPVNSDPDTFDNTNGCSNNNTDNAGIPNSRSNSNSNDATSTGTISVITARTLSTSIDIATSNSNSKRVDAADNSSTSNIVRSNEPEHECTRTPAFDVSREVQPLVTPCPDKPERPSPAIRRTQPPSPPTSVVQPHTRHTTDNNADNISSSSRINASDANADTLDDSSGTTITPPIRVSTSTTVPDNEPERRHERARTPPLKVQPCPALPTNLIPIAPCPLIVQSHMRPITCISAELTCAPHVNVDDYNAHNGNSNEPEHECACTPPLEARTQPPLIVAPPLDKPEETPQNRTRVDVVDNSSTSNAVHSNEPEHECTRMACTPPLEVDTRIPPVATPPPDKPEEPPPALLKNTTPSAPTHKPLAHRLQTCACPSLTYSTTRPLVSQTQRATQPTKACFGPIIIISNQM
jgi:hypothetical protein